MASPSATFTTASNAGDTLADAALYDTLLVSSDCATSSLLLGFATTGGTPVTSALRITHSNITINGSLQAASNIYAQAFSNVGGVTYAGTLVGAILCNCTVGGGGTLGTGGGTTTTTATWPVWSSNGSNMYVTSNVGIGTAAPAYMLDVNGTIRATGDVIANSDMRFKTDLTLIPHALDKVGNLRGYTFKTLADSGGVCRRHAGVLAQDVQRVMPELVHGDETMGLSVAYGNMAGLFVEAIRELTGRATAAEGKLAALEEMLAALQAQTVQHY